MIVYFESYCYFVVFDGFFSLYCFKHKHTISIHQLLVNNIGSKHRIISFLLLIRVVHFYKIIPISYYAFILTF